MTYRLPLFDHRVLDLTDGHAGYAGRILGDMGAEVIKVEPTGGDSLRGSDAFDAANVNKYSCALNVASHPDIVARLAEISDVSISNTGTIDAASLRASNETLIVVEIPPGAGPVSCTAAAGAVGLALWDRRRTGKGGVIRVAALDTGPRIAEVPSPAVEEVSSLGGDRKVPASPMHLSETPLHIRLPAPALGEHNAYVFRHLLGLSQDEIAALS